RREFRSGFFADLRADVRVPVWVWEEEVQSQPIVRLSAHVSYSYFHFTLADHVFEIACTHSFAHRKLSTPIRALSFSRGGKMTSPKWRGSSTKRINPCNSTSKIKTDTWFTRHLKPTHPALRPANHHTAAQSCCVWTMTICFMR